MKETTKIKLTEEELKDILIERFNLENKGGKFKVINHEGDRPWESSFTTFEIEGTKKSIQHKTSCS